MALIAAAVTQTTVLFTVSQLYADVGITAVTISASPLYTGASTDIQVTLENTGTISANVSINVSIFNSTGGFIENITYAPAILAAHSSLTIASSWSTGSNPAGTYYANASGLYENNTNATNVYSTQFTISTTPTVQPTIPPSSGGPQPPSSVGNGSAVVPTPLPPDFEPQFTEVRFIKSTVLKEVHAGTSVLESLVLKNVAGATRDIVFKISGAPASWLSYSPQKTILLPNEERVLNLAITVPQNALPGDYLLKIEALEDAVSSFDYMLLRVKSATRGAQLPAVLKTIRLDRGLDTTSVTIDVINPSTKVLPHVGVVEEVLPQFRITEGDIEFIDKPAHVSGTPLQIRWRFRELQPLEKARVSYIIYSMLSEYRPYVYWSVKQVEVAPKEIKLSDIINIRDISSSVIAEGGEGEVVGRIFYSGFEPVKFEAALELPTGFETLPRSISGVLQPRGTTELKFNVRAPADSAGTHSATLTVYIDEETLLRGTGYINVQSPTALSWQFPAGLLFLVLLLILSLLHFMGKKKESQEKRTNIELRSGYIKQIKDYLK